MIISSFVLVTSHSSFQFHVPLPPCVQATCHCFSPSNGILLTLQTPYRNDMFAQLYFWGWNRTWHSVPWKQYFFPMYLNNRFPTIVKLQRLALLQKQIE